MWISRVLFVLFAFVSICAFAQGPDAKDGEPLQTMPIDEDYINKSKLFFHLYSRGYNDVAEILFTCTESEFGSYIVGPSIITSVAGKWTRYSVPAPMHDWRWAGRSMDGKYVWGVLDNVPQGPAHELMFVMSEDFGATWEVTQFFKKYFHTSYFNDFRMDKNGKGKIIIWYPVNLGGPDSEVGYHSYSTNDWGRTWTDELDYEPDFVSHASGDSRISLNKKDISEGMKSVEGHYERQLQVNERRKKERELKESESN